MTRETINKNNKQFSQTIYQTLGEQKLKSIEIEKIKRYL